MVIFLCNVAFIAITRVEQLFLSVSYHFTNFHSPFHRFHQSVISCFYIVSLSLFCFTCLFFVFVHYYNIVRICQRFFSSSSSSSFTVHHFFNVIIFFSPVFYLTFFLFILALYVHIVQFNLITSLALCVCVCVWVCVCVFYCVWNYSFLHFHLFLCLSCSMCVCFFCVVSYKTWDFSFFFFKAAF